MSKKCSLFTALLFLAFSHSGVSSAGTWYVNIAASDPRDGRSLETGFEGIQEGIDAASDGDKVVVAEGTYVENIHFNGKNIVLRSTDPLDPDVVANTIIDGNAAGSVVTFSGTEDETCVLCGFTIRNGKAHIGAGICGGMFDYALARIENNIITGNSARDGGGLYRCHGTVQNNTIVANSAGQSGGGLYQCHGTVHNNIITDNSAGYGGGLSQCDGTIQNNTIVANSAGGSGGGLPGCNGIIRNCIIWGNKCTSGAQLSPSAKATYSCIEAWTGGGEGNTRDDPGFVDGAGGDYHLRDGSPCVDTGANYYWSTWPQRDLDGNCRLVGERVDMGCYEYGSSPDSDGDLLSDEGESDAATDPNMEDTDGDGLRDGLEVLRGSEPLEPMPPEIILVPADVGTIQRALSLALPGDEIIVAPGTYAENVQFCGTDVILRSSDPVNRDVVANTIIDGNAAGSVVTFSGTEDETCVLSGFTIQNGKGPYGGGICGGTPGTRSHATIQNNVISGNSADHGGGLYGCYGTIQNNVMSGNSADHGGGLLSCDGTIQNNTIIGNSAGFEGGGLSNCHGLIRNNTIAGNSTSEWWHGGGLFDCNGAIRNNIISDNSAGHGGGLLWCMGRIENNTICHNSAYCGAGLDACDGVIRNNVISGNSADEYGGGLYFCMGRIENNTICDNSAHYGGGLYGCAYATIVNCTIWGNSPDQLSWSPWKTGDVAHSCIQGWTEGGEGNIAEDPGFVDPDGPDDDPETYEDNNYRLSDDSPCIDAGKNEEWMWEALDPDGNPRVADGDGDGLPVVDMGAYEYPGPPPGSITLRSNIQADYVLRKLPGGDAIEGRTEATADPKVFEKVYEGMEEGTWQITWRSQSDAWPRKPVTEEKELPEGGAIVFKKDYIVRMPSEIYQLQIEPVNYSTGTFFAHVGIKNTTGPDNPPARTFTVPIWLVVEDIVFTVSGPNSEGRLWNADGITSEEYPDSGDYYYVDVSDWAALDPGETSSEMVLEFYIKDRNPNFEPEIEVWAYDPVVVAAGSQFRVERVASQPAGSIVVQWESEEGAVYVVEAADSPMGPWIPISEEIPSGGQITQWADWPPEDITARFYRIRGPCP